MKNRVLILISVLLISIFLFTAIGCKDAGEGASTDYDISFDDLGVAATANITAQATAVDESKITKLNQDGDS